VTATTTALGGSATTTTVYTNGSAGLSFTGLGTSSATVSLALVTNKVYQSVVVTATDADGLSVTAPSVRFDTLTPALVIEASDFNYSSGGFIDTPPNGGLALYAGQIGVSNIDEVKLVRAGGTQSYYRTNDTTILMAANPTSGTEQKFVTGGGTNFEVSIQFDSVGDWQNYSRTFANSGGSAKPGTYNVWCYLATSGSGSQVVFSQVTNSPSTTGQITNIIGTFGGATFSDNSFNNYVYAPLLDQFGNTVALTITNGVQTFRGTIINSDTPNVAFYMLVPAVPVLTPVVLNAYPNGPFQPTNSYTFTVGPAQGAAIATNGIVATFTMNGAPVSMPLTFTPFGGGWTVSTPLLSNELYTVTINVTNLAGSNITYSAIFDTMNLNNFHWMAVDYDYSTNNGSSTGGTIGDGWTGGLYIDNPIPTGDSQAPTNSSIWELQTNSYFGYPTGFGPSFGPLGGDMLAGLGAVAHQGVDINWPTNGTQDPGGVISNSIYRLSSVYIGGAAELNGGDGVGTQVASDSFLLPEFIFAQTNNASGLPDPALCEFNVGYFYTNNWLNYTRTYPSGTFNVWGRLGAGGGAFSGCTLSMVTSGAGTSNQTTQVLGTFSDAAPSGWQVYHWIPLLDTNGNQVYVQLSGKATLRLTAPANAGPGGAGLNPLFIMLAPAIPPVTAFSISAKMAGANVQISIPTQTGHSYTIWYSGSLSPASWGQVGGSITGDGNVHVVNQTPVGDTGFYQVRAQ
jgi:hypothetical protein